VNQWRFIIDLRHLNTFCVRKRLRLETLLHVRHLTPKGDYLFSFDLQDGLYALGIRPLDRDFLKMNIRGQHFRLGWSLSTYYFCAFTNTFIRHLRAGARTTTSTPPHNSPRLRLMPNVDDFIVFTTSHQAALQARSLIASFLDRLGMSRHPSKGLWDPVQYGQHMGIDIDTAHGTFYAPATKLDTLA
jgi:hypothetical protein